MESQVPTTRIFYQSLKLPKTEKASSQLYMLNFILSIKEPQGSNSQDTWENMWQYMPTPAF